MMDGYPHKYAPGGECKAVTEQSQPTTLEFSQPQIGMDGEGINVDAAVPF